MDRDSQQTGTNTYVLSVVVPTRDRREILARSLEALARQTFPDYEIIIIDDGSTDGTQELVERFIAGHPNLATRFLRNETSIGANRSRNRGIREARGEFVAFQDSDCIAEPDWLEKLLAGFTSERVAAVTGLVNDPPASNVYELAFKGTHRLHRAPQAHRLVGGNMCIRRHLLLERPLDEDLRWGCDEEGIFLWLRAMGYEQMVVPDAIVLHEHHYTRRSLFRQAYDGGGATARFVYKYHLPPRLDLLPFILAYATLPLMVICVWSALISVFFFAVALAAITYNDICRKGKTISETIRSFPVLLAYYHVRLAGYVTEAVALRLRRPDIKREPLVSKGPAGPNRIGV